MMKTALKSIVEAIAPRVLYRYQILRNRQSDPELSLLSMLCKKDSLSIDVGANQGLYCYYMLPYSAAVVAFEPVPLMHHRLTVLFGDRILNHAVALSDCDGVCELRMPSEHAPMATIEAKNPLMLGSDSGLEIHRVPKRRLDCYQFETVGFIKMDVEGHEEAVLRGSIQTLTLSKPNLLIEIEERHNPGAINRITAFLAALGYEGYFYDEDRFNPLDTFDTKRDQPTDHICESGKCGRYINNFVFINRQS
jgi:FkbM family methyltransferase